MLPRNPVVDERLVALLQEVTPQAPDALRLRVASLAAAGPSTRPSRLPRLPRRRAVLLVAAACLVAALGAAAVRGIVTAASSDDRAASPEDTSALRRTERAVPAQALRPAISGEESADATSALPPSPTRLQDYGASLRLRVRDADDLSARTKQVLRLTRGFGGYVVSVRYGIGREGDAVLDLRVPVERVQEVLVRFSGLGTILEQRVSIRDLQGRVDEQTRRIERLDARIAALREALADKTLTTDERAALEARLERARAARARLQEARTRLVRAGSFAHVSLALTTRKPAPVAGDEPGRIERALGDAGSLLDREAAVALYALIVTGPGVLLLLLGAAAARAGRRRARERLLGRA